MHQLKYWCREVTHVLTIIAYFASWIVMILALYRQDTPIMSLLGIGLYVVSMLSIVRGGK